MWMTISNIILRNRLVIITMLTLLTVFFGYKAITGMQLDNRYGILLPNDAKEKIDYEKFKDLFGEDGGTLAIAIQTDSLYTCLLYTSPSPRDQRGSRMPSSA